MTPKLHRLAPVVVLALAACSQPATPKPEPAPSAAAPQSDGPELASAPQLTEPPPPSTYACKDGRVVRVAYQGGDAARLEMNGRSHQLRIAVSASGARYVGDGLQWWTKGMDDGRLSRLRRGEKIAKDPGVACRRKDAALPPVEPPAPGTPGGLADDRTPVSEAPFAPNSPQGAANVVQTYYAHIGQKAWPRAWKLWGNGGKASGFPTAEAFSASFERYSQYNAQVGAPGEQEGAAGSSYVTVPVVIYGRLKSGAEVHEKGEATLRRVNDVPGSTPEQRAWHIEKIETQPSA